MRVFHFTEQPYTDAWDLGVHSLRVDFPNRHCDPAIAADLYHRYLDEYLLADELGLNIMLNEHHSTATCLSSAASVELGILARQTRRARLLTLGMPIANRPDPLRVAEELSVIDVISRGRLEMGLIRGIAYEIPSANSNPVRMMDRFWEANDLIIKAMTTHDGPFSWEGEFFHYRSVNIWPRPFQQPHPPAWITGLNLGTAREAAKRNYVFATMLGGYNSKTLYDAYREVQRGMGMPRTSVDRFAYLGLVAVAATEQEALTRAEHIADYVRTIDRQPPRYRHTPGYMSAKDTATVLKHAPPRTLLMKDGRKVPFSPNVSVADLMQAGVMFAGTPDQVYAQIVEFLNAVGGFGNLLIMGHGGRLSHAATCDSLTLFAKEVLPRLGEYHAGAEYHTKAA